MDKDTSGGDAYGHAVTVLFIEEDSEKKTRERHGRLPTCPRGVDFKSTSTECRYSFPGSFGYVFFFFLF